MSEDIEQRIVGIESHLAHQAEELKEMSEVLSRQWQMLDDLTRRMARMEDRLRAVEGGLEEILPREAPPPHY